MPDNLQTTHSDLYIEMIFILLQIPLKYVIMASAQI